MRVRLHPRRLSAEYCSDRNRTVIWIHGSGAVAEDLRGTLAQRAVDRSLGRPAHAVCRRDPTGARGHVRPHRAHRRTSTRRCARSWPRPASPPRPSTGTSSRRTSCSSSCSTTAAGGSSPPSSAGCSGSTTPEARVRAWIEGVLAQATDTRAAGRTRPFVTDQDRLAEAFPASSRRRSTSSSISSPRPSSSLHGRANARDDAVVVYRAAFTTLHDHLLHGTRPTAAETDHLVRFCLAGHRRRPTRGGTT